MAAVVAVANLKGGVGKSTIAVNLACALTAGGDDSLVVDADTQGTSTFWKGQGQLPVRLTAMPLEDRAGSESWLSRLLPRGDEEDQTRVRKWKRELKSARASFVVVDCPPHVGLATRAAVSIADLVLVPVTGTAADVAATKPALQLVARARARRKDKGPRCLIIPSRVDRSTATGKVIEGILKSFGEAIGPAIAQRVAFADSVAFGTWIGEHAPDSPGHQEILNLAECVRVMLPWATAPKSSSKAGKK
ncbi:MAG: ParA family protein [Pseudomonadota bacterium]